MRLAGTWKQYSKKAIDQLIEDHLPERLLLILQVAVPGNGHEDVGEDEKNDGPHFVIRCAGADGVGVREIDGFQAMGER